MKPSASQTVPAYILKIGSWAGTGWLAGIWLRVSQDDLVKRHFFIILTIFRSQKG